MNLENARISILGAAKSGLAAAKTLLNCGSRVFVSDIQAEEKLKKTLEDKGLLDSVTYEAGGHSTKVLDADFIVLSPGVRPDIPILIQACEKSIPVYSEIEIAYRISRGRRLVITGSNGKTTTTTLLSEFCRQQYDEVFMGGNIGIPMMEFAAQTTDNSVQVLEVSSFQLETIADFTPDIAVITNFFENHLDRYSSYQAYIEAKKRICLNMTSGQWLILNSDQPAMHEFAASAKARLAWFGWDAPKQPGPFVTIIDNRFVYRDSSGALHDLFSVDEVRLIGRHNLENIMCAALAALLAGVDKAKLAEVVRGFTGVEHRLEWVREINSVTFINDSKGTNCAASITALKACRQPVILVAGGRDKGTDLSEWIEAVRSLSRGVVLCGEARQRFRSALEGRVSIKVSNTFEDAIKQAYSWAEPGDTVLLSPACSSYDMFPDFVARGKAFKKIVKELEA